MAEFDSTVAPNMLDPKNPHRKGALIVFEGIDGCGKTSQAGFLMSRLKERGVRVNFSCEPTDGEYGRALRKSFTGERRLAPPKELRLFQLDRLEHVNNIIKPGLAEGWVLLVDRYYYSSIAYQGALGWKRPEDIHRMMVGFAPVPDVTLIFDIPPEIALERIANSRGDIPNLMEKRANLERVRAIYRAMNYPEVVHVKADLNPKQVFQQVLKAAVPLLTEKGLYGSAAGE